MPSNGSRVRSGSSEIGGLAFIESHVAPLEERPDVHVARPQALVSLAGSQSTAVHRKNPQSIRALRAAGLLKLIVY